MMTLSRILVGVVAAAAIGIVAYRARALSASGAVTAGVLGTVAVAAAWNWGALLMIYFVAATGLSRFGARRKRERVSGMLDKVGPRDGWQVLSNGGPFLVAASGILLSPGHAPIWMLMGAGSLAASSADTWATEVGTLTGQPPRSILTGRPLAVGESGGVSVAGSIASMGGAVFVAAAALACGWDGAMALPIAVGGIAGSLADSVAGAALQRRSWCDACARATEMRVHDCGAPTRFTGGLTWLENDGVNLVATVVGAVVAVAAG